MSKEKILSYASTAFELTKMVFVITTNTAIKLISEGKKEVVKQYAEYNQKHPQSEGLKKLAAVSRDTVKAAEKKLKVGNEGKDVGKTGKK